MAKSIKTNLEILLVRAELTGETKTSSIPLKRPLTGKEIGALTLEIRA